MVLESATKYVKCKCGGSLYLIERNKNILLNENGDKRVNIFVYECIRCKWRLYRSYDQVPDEEERAQWALEEEHLQSLGQVEPFYDSHKGEDKI